MAVARRQHDSLWVGLEAKVAARPGLDRRQMAPRGMISVTTEILGRELPVARHDPFVHAADDLDPAVAAIEERVEIPRHLAEILAQWRRLGVEGREPQTLVIVELRDRH